MKTRLELARAELSLGDLSRAGQLLDEIADVLERRPDLGVLPRQVEDLRTQLEARRRPGERTRLAFTAAELRLLPLLATHLSFPEIAEQLYISRNTVKTQAISIYRKLGVSSRSAAIAQARGLGLVSSPRPPDVC